MHALFEIILATHYFVGLYSLFEIFSIFGIIFATHCIVGLYSLFGIILATHYSVGLYSLETRYFVDNALGADG